MPNSIEQILEREQVVAAPGIFDTLSARISERTGFPFGFISGYSVAATAIGEPDFGLLTQTEIVERARRVCMSVDLPIIVDADTGYGNALNVYRTVRELIAAGAKGCFLEDQEWPKRCGHMRGKTVIDRNLYWEKIHAAVDARADEDFFIVARTDALATDGMDEALCRVTGARQRGANASFIEAPQDVEQLERIGQDSPSPNVANMIHGGATPVLSRERLRELGFHIILHPLTGLYSAARTMQRIFQKLRDDGDTFGFEDELMSFAEFNELIGVEEKYELSKKYGATADDDAVS